MAQNTLFNFIDLYLAGTAVSLPKCQQMTKNTNQEGRAYYCFELQLNKPVVLDDEFHQYTLINHHVSVYETEKGANPYLSQYHYTAYFLDEKENEYQLHIYFNDKNEMTTKPVLSVRDKTNQFVPVESEQLHEELINLAVSNSKPLITLIRQQLTTKIKTLETEYKKLEEEASTLSISLEQNYDQYLAKINEVSATTKRLIPLVKHERYQHTHNFINQFKTALIERHEFQQKTKEMGSSRVSDQISDTSNATFPTQSSVAVNDTSEKTTQQSKQSHRRTQKRLKQTSFDTTVQDMMSKFEKLKTEKDEIKAMQIADLLANTYALSLELETNKTLASLDALTSLKTLHKNLYEEGEKLFPRLLIGGQFKLVQQLSAFYYLLDDYLDLALQTRKPELLAFILENSDININTQEVNVRQKTYASAVHCCLSCDSEKTPMTECLSVLIEQGASILGSDETGLPIAHTIFSTPDHPLLKALYTNREKTLESISFYKQLISLVKLYLKQNPQLEEKTQTNLEKEITVYQSFISELSTGYKPTNASERRLKAILVKFAEKHLNSDSIKKALNDSELIALSEELKMYKTQVTAKLSPAKHKQLTSLTANYYDNLDKAIDYLGSESLDSTELKAKLVEHFTNRIEMMKKLPRLMEVQKFLSAHSGYGNLSRKKRKMLQEEETLVKEINQIAKNCKGYEAVDLEALKRTDQEMQQLQELSKTLDEVKKNLEMTTSFLSSFSKTLKSLVSNNHSGLEDLREDSTNSVKESNNQEDEKDLEETKTYFLSQLSNSLKALGSNNGGIETLLEGSINSVIESNNQGEEKENKEQKEDQKSFSMS